MKAKSGKPGHQWSAGGVDGGGHRLGCIRMRAICYSYAYDALWCHRLLPYCRGSLSRTSLEDAGGSRLKHFPDGKEADHGGGSSVVDAGGLVRRVKLW